MAADAWIMYNKALEYIGDGTIDLDTHTFKIALFTSAMTPNVATQSVLADITANQLSTANGYTSGGATLGTVTWTESSGTVTFDADDPSWTASGGSITARYAVIYDDTPTSPADPLLCYSLLDNSPADVTVTDGNTLTIQLNASGIFTVAKA